MGNIMDRMAQEVIIRSNIEDRDEPYVFTVDGEDFPWYISETGPIVTRLADDFYSVYVEIFLMDKETHDYLPFSYVLSDFNSPPTWPIIAGNEFPWLLTEDGAQLNMSGKMIPTLKLAFLAQSVTANIPIEDKRPAGDIFCNGGDLIHSDVVESAVVELTPQTVEEYVARRTRDIALHGTA